ncbi:hypothetical protein CJ485_24635 [Priestia filamentosa]|nr:hypothetical protein B1B01_23235 [Priestia filamentosa]RJS62883.1 hypothetical protein CJ485_24635 [Priestia filamentosa]
MEEYTMENSTLDQEKAYWTREVAELLDIKEGTVRKYARLMEENGYNFHRNEHDQRGFFERDILLMKRIKALSKTKGVTLEDAVNTVTKGIVVPEREPMTHTVMNLQEELERSIERHKQTMEAFIELKNENTEMKELLINLSEQMKQQQTYIENSLEKRDQVLLESIQKTLEQRREEENTGWFKKLFKSK